MARRADGRWELDVTARRFTTSQYCRIVFALGPDDAFERVEDLEALIHPEDRPRRQAAVEHAIATGLACSIRLPQSAKICLAGE